MQFVWEIPSNLWLELRQIRTAADRWTAHTQNRPARPPPVFVHVFIYSIQTNKLVNGCDDFEFWLNTSNGDLCVRICIRKRIVSIQSFTHISWKKMNKISLKTNYANMLLHIWVLSPFYTLLLNWKTIFCIKAPVHDPS